MSFANVSDISDRLGRPIVDDAEIRQVNAWINDVQMIIQSRIPEMWAIQSDVLTFVIASAVIRKIKNPDGKQNERVDDYSYGLNEDAARGELFLTDDEWALLQEGQTDGAFSIVPGGRPAGAYWWPTTDRWEPL